MRGSHREEVHPPEHQLLACAEGELSDREAQAVRTHVDQCESCREQMASLRATLAEYMEHRCAVMEAEDSAWRVNAFESRLRREPDQPSPRRWRNLIQTLHSFRFAPSAAALIALILILLQLTSPPVISAQEALSRAAAADARAVQSVADPVVYQKIRLHRSRGSRPETSITFETWNRRGKSRKASRGGSAPWTEVEAVFANNGMDAFEPLAAAGFDAWRRSLENRKESVSDAKLDNGSKAIVVTAGPAGRVAEGALVEASLVIRADDWHPVKESLHVQRPGEVEVYEIVELAYEVLPTASLDAGVLAMLGTAPASPPLPPPVVSRPVETTASSRVPNPEQALVEALYALHKVHACLGEPIEVTRAGGSVLVRGVVETAARKQEITDSLRDISGVRLELRTAEEYLRSAASRPDANRGEQPAESFPAVIPDPAGPVASRLATPELTDAANLAVTAADDALVEAWALRRMAEVYPADRILEVGPEARTYLHTMVRDHAQGLNRKLRDMRSKLDLVRASETPPAVAPPDRFEWPVGVSELFNAVEQERRLVRSLFSQIGSSSFPETARRVAAAAVQAEQRGAQLERDLALLFRGPQEHTLSDLGRK